ncbi:MAG: hypothetical protein ACOYOA_05300 [Saprospiraceae bacterium]|jgi:hypothetical protein
MFFSSNKNAKKSLGDLKSGRDIKVIDQKDALAITGGKKSTYIVKKTTHNWLGFPSSGNTAQP